MKLFSALLSLTVNAALVALFAAGPAASAAERTAAPARAAAASSPAAEPVAVERGRYLVQITGCNDCHTAGYAESGGQVPAAEWLTGVPVGFAGPWGVSYPANLRLTVQAVSEEQWLALARAQRLPPMPWFALRDMSDEDLRSMYRFIRSLGPKGERAPPPVAPGERASTPVIPFVAMSPEAFAAARASDARRATRVSQASR